VENRPVNNAIYESLGDRWYTAQDDPVALLRAEARLRNPWIRERITTQLGVRPVRVLDVGCGAGFLTNYLAADGHEVTGLDNSRESLAVAARRDLTGRARYHHGDALALPFESGSFDVVCALDFLEHVDDIEGTVSEMARVLSVRGLFFFHTFDRNWLSWLVVIKGVEWFVKNTPRDMHVLSYFVKPSELTALVETKGMDVIELLGSRPCFDKHMWKMLCTGTVPPDFGFTFSPSTRLGYTGIARKWR
jgi:2-polyprenyl-6-hydroxyphenyl methylase/3-demethylubiquinone-9 3-methyltransferase